MTPKSINIAVADQVQTLGSEKIINTVVDRLVFAEVQKRADALAAAVKLSEDIMRELRKASKPDQIAIAGDGVKTETFSPKAYEAKKKLDEKLARIDTVVTNATEKSDWAKLYELVKGGASNETKPNDGETNN